MLQYCALKYLRSFLLKNRKKKEREEKSELLVILRIISSSEMRSFLTTGWLPRRSTQRIRRVSVHVSTHCWIHRIKSATTNRSLANRINQVQTGSMETSHSLETLEWTMKNEFRTSRIHFLVSVAWTNHYPASSTSSTNALFCLVVVSTIFVDGRSKFTIVRKDPKKTNHLFNSKIILKKSIHKKRESREVIVPGRIVTITERRTWPPVTCTRHVPAAYVQVISPRLSPNSSPPRNTNGSSKSQHFSVHTVPHVREYVEHD